MTNKRYWATVPGNLNLWALREEGRAVGEHLAYVECLGTNRYLARIRLDDAGVEFEVFESAKTFAVDVLDGRKRMPPEGSRLADRVPAAVEEAKVDHGPPVVKAQYVPPAYAGGPTPPVKPPPWPGDEPVVEVEMTPRLNPDPRLLAGLEMRLEAATQNRRALDTAIRYVKCHGSADGAKEGIARERNKSRTQVVFHQARADTFDLVESMIDDELAVMAEERDR